MQNEQLKTQSASRRGERLYPSRTHRTYWPLTSLRENLLGIISEYLEGQHRDLLVDYGCGNMPYRSLFEPHVAKYLGFDLLGNELADSLLDQSNFIPISSGTADILLSSQVLEHVEEPVQYLEESWRVLKQGGLLILSTHGVWRFHPDPHDYWRWTSSGLRRIVENAGFTVLDFRGILGPTATGIQLWQDSVLSNLYRPFRKAFAFIVQQSVRAADRACSSNVRNADASIYVLVARKNQWTH